jgi:hypothetical protein
LIDPGRLVNLPTRSQRGSDPAAGRRSRHHYHTDGLLVDQLSRWLFLRLQGPEISFRPEILQPSIWRKNGLKHHVT